MRYWRVKKKKKKGLGQGKSFDKKAGKRKKTKGCSLGTVLLERYDRGLAGARALGLDKDVDVDLG